MEPGNLRSTLDRPRRGLTCPTQCGCPHWLAAGSVNFLNGKLRTILKENDRARDWKERLGLGNPAASLLVRKYLKCIKEERATAGLTLKQATPLFVDKLDYLHRQLEACKTYPIKMYILSRDQALFKTFLWGQV